MVRCQQLVFPSTIVPRDCLPPLPSIAFEGAPVSQSSAWKSPCWHSCTPTEGHVWWNVARISRSPQRFCRSRMVVTDIMVLPVTDIKQMSDTWMIRNSAHIHTQQYCVSCACDALRLRPAGMDRSCMLTNRWTMPTSPYPLPTTVLAHYVQYSIKSNKSTTVPQYKSLCLETLYQYCNYCIL